MLRVSFMAARLNLESWLKAFSFCSKPKVVVDSFSADLERRVCSDDSRDLMRVSDERRSRHRKFTTLKFRQNNRRGRFYCRVECSGLYDVCRSASPNLSRTLDHWCINWKKYVAIHRILYIRAILEEIYLKKCQTDGWKYVCIGLRANAWHIHTKIF